LICSYMGASLIFFVHVLRRFCIIRYISGRCLTFIFNSDILRFVEICGMWRHSKRSAFCTSYRECFMFPGLKLFYQFIKRRLQHVIDK
jgi:hypothetical protein